MILVHARALSHTLIYRSSDPLTTYPKAADVPNSDADDWEPIQTNPAAVTAEPPADCGCGQTAKDDDVS